MRPESPSYQGHRLLHAIHRRRNRAHVDRISREILDNWDQPAFRERFRRFWDPFPSEEAFKFLNLDLWFREAVFRYLFLGVPNLGTGLQVLDLGAGTGYFLVVCRHFGHHVLGIDVSDEPLYNECFEYFGLPRVEHRIEPMQPLPEFANRFDLITAFMTCFNWHEDLRPWGAEPWRFFLKEIRDRLTEDGQAVLKLNLNPKTGEYYSAEVRRTIKGCGFFRARFFLDYVFLAAS